MSACDISQMDCFRSDLNKASVELPDQEITCLETGFVFRVKDTVYRAYPDRPDPREKAVVYGRIYRFRLVRDRYCADVEFNQNTLRFMKCIPLSELLNANPAKPKKGAK